jgi:hypothetical protein
MHAPEPKQKTLLPRQSLSHAPPRSLLPYLYPRCFPFPFPSLLGPYIYMCVYECLYVYTYVLRPNLCAHTHKCENKARQVPREQVLMAYAELNPKLNEDLQAFRV